MQITWSDIGKSEAPGEFQTRFGPVSVRANHIAIWKENPTALFTLVPYSTISPPKRGFHLGTYSIPGE